MTFDYFLLPIFFFIGLITGYEDIRYGKIKNKWIVFGFTWALSVYFLFLLWNLLPLGGLKGEISFLFLGKSFLNSFIALFLAYLIWRARGWSAGDGKLFFLFSFLIPITYYQKSYLPIFPSFALLINIFLPLLLFLFLRSCFLFLKMRGRGAEILKSFIADKDYWATTGILLLGFLGMVLFFGFLWEEIGKYFFVGDIFFLQTLFIVALIIFIKSAGIFSKRAALVKKTALSIFAFSAGYGFIFAPHLFWQIFSRVAPWMALLMLILGLSRKFLFFYVANEEKEGRKTFPMAIWIFLGGIITLILKESVLSLILKYIFS